MASKQERVPEVLRQALAEELQKVAGYPREVIEDPAMAVKEKLAAWQLLAQYGLGTATEVRHDGEVTHAVVMLPPLDRSSRALPAGEIVQDQLEMSE